MAAKTVLCIRHGQSTFNAIHPGSGIDPLHYDARLSELGHEQVREAREKLRSVEVDLVIVSPLTRALQTAQGLFSNHPSSPAFLVEATHRERVENSCDVGRSPSFLSQEFPGLALGHLPEVWWHHLEPDERGVSVESIESVQTRVEEFRGLLSRRPERKIAVVGHGTFFYYLTGKWLTNCEIVELAIEIED